MKNKMIKTLAVIAALVAMQSVSQATLVAGFSGSTTLTPLPAGSSTLTVTYSVDLTAGVYTYSYSLASSAPPEALSSFAVFVGDASVVIAGSVAGGTAANFAAGDSVYWSFNPALTTAGPLTFQSLKAPNWAPASAVDGGGISWASPNNVPSPVPEPSTVVAGALLLLPFGISTLRIMRKKNVA